MYSAKVKFTKTQPFRLWWTARLLQTCINQFDFWEKENQSLGTPKVNSRHISSSTSNMASIRDSKIEHSGCYHICCSWKLTSYSLVVFSTVICQSILDFYITSVNVTKAHSKPPCLRMQRYTVTNHHCNLQWCLSQAPHEICTNLFFNRSNGNWHWEFVTKTLRIQINKADSLS